MSRRRQRFDTLATVAAQKLQELTITAEVSEKKRKKVEMSPDGTPKVSRKPKKSRKKPKRSRKKDASEGTVLVRPMPIREGIQKVQHTRTSFVDVTTVNPFDTQLQQQLLLGYLMQAYGMIPSAFRPIMYR